MRERERLLWSVLIILLLIIAGYIGYNAYHMGRQARHYQEALRMETLGSEDPQLRNTVEQLEAELRKRLDYQFEINNDPLDLTQVIQTEKFLAKMGFTESLESQNVMRLSCTIIGENPVAIIKYQGRSRIVHLGDEIGGYRVTSIEQKRAVLQSPYEKLELVTQKAPDTIQKQKALNEGKIAVRVPQDTLPRNY
jgi:hypothetical protein